MKEGSNSYCLDCSKLIPWSKIDITIVRRFIVLVICGSFNPIHNAHIAMYDAAFQHLNTIDGEETLIVGGFLSPVNDNYGKKKLYPFSVRSKICKAAVKSHPTLSIDTWEGINNTYIRTYHVLEHLQKEIQQWYEEDANPGVVQQLWLQQHPINIYFVCGTDIFESFLRPGCWPIKTLTLLLNNYNIMVVRRHGLPKCKEILETKGSTIEENITGENGEMKLEILNLLNYQFEETEILDSPISSSVIRELLQNDPNADLRDFIPEDAIALVREYYTSSKD